MKLVESGGVGDIGEDDRRAVDKSACCDRTVQCILNRRTCGSGAHAALSVNFRGALRQSSGKQ